MPRVTPRRFRARAGLMTKPMLLASALFAATAMPSLAGAGTEEVRAAEAKHLQLGEFTGVAYYTVQGEGFHVVATLAEEVGAPVRFEGILLPGQKIVMSVPGAVGNAARTVAFLRRGDHLLVETDAVQTE
jgi:hypothetical protein